ncbi:MAG: hypothetical protein ABSF93_00400 [Candidatus Sulfotelmatobacter sp.]|jgi:hypothetical protein
MGVAVIIALLTIIALQLWTISDRLRRADSAQEKELRELLHSELRYRAQQRDGDIEIHRDHLIQARERAKERGKQFADEFCNFSKKPE